jgi:SHS family lactate transporter-like MFS transporter
MAIVADAAVSIAWWKEPTRDQWFAWIAAWLGWMLDAFDFTIFLLIMAPIATEFGVSVTAVAAVLTLTLWLRLVGAVGAGWLADRIGRKTPLMLSILWYSAAISLPAFHQASRSCLLSAPRLGSAWAPNGRSAQLSQWNHGLRARAA